jgi:hypothetical protein
MDENLLSPLRDATSSAPDWDAMEGRLLATMRHAKAASAARETGRSPARSGWFAAAAGIVIAAALTYQVGPLQEEPAPHATSEAPKRDVRLPSDPHVTSPGPPLPPSPPQPRRPTRRLASPASAVSAANPPALDEFLLLPGAAALPPLESGRIVRLEVPLTSLPAYGLDVVPDASPAAVHADFLIGHDGLPRAIRLARSSR